MPHKFNAARRHKFDKAQYRVINWAEYNESLRQRGDLTIWVSEEAQSVWIAPRCGSCPTPIRSPVIMALISARNSSRAYSADPKPSAMPFLSVSRFKRSGWPVEWPHS